MDSFARQPAPPDLIVDVKNVHRSFGDVHALNDLTIQVPRGSISVLLGPNGAGKTTAIRMITGALGPDLGTSRVFGLDPVSSDGEEVRRRCGVVSAKPSLYDRLSGWDNLRYAAELYGLGKGRTADDAIRQAAAKFAIEHALDQEVGGYSTGMKTRLALSRSILHDPDLLLLDEPTSGLDPESAVAVLELIRNMTNEGRTVLMCTHLLLEAEGLADEVVIMQHGTSLEWGAPAALAEKYLPAKRVHIGVTLPSHLQMLTGMPGVEGFETADSAAVVQVKSFDAVPDIVNRLVSGGAMITSVSPFVPNLEDIYFAIRREKGSSADELPPPADPTARPSRSRVAELAR
ncbi:MAG: ABC transporter ATP-binding protein [Acidimicrobiales bacterium]